MLFIAIALFVTIGLFLPSEWKVERSIVINASPAEVHKYVDDLKLWQAWTPWNTTVDETLQLTYGERSSGTGASQTWSGEGLGQGEIHFESSDPEKGVVYRLKLAEGDVQSQGAFLYERVDGGTKVTWKDGGDSGNDILKRYVAYFLLDNHIGPEFEHGLSTLKQVVEQKDEDKEAPAP
jgi:hypothetical protein